MLDREFQTQSGQFKNKFESDMLRSNIKKKDVVCEISLKYFYFASLSYKHSFNIPFFPNQEEIQISFLFVSSIKRLGW